MAADEHQIVCIKVQGPKLQLAEYETLRDTLNEKLNLKGYVCLTNKSMYLKIGTWNNDKPIELGRKIKAELGETWVVLVTGFAMVSHQYI